MADSEGTQNSGTAASGESSSNSSSAQQGTQQSQLANTGSQVDGNGAEGNRNSDRSDDGNGGDGDAGGRGRASRADRRFSDLTSKIKDLERESQGKDQLINSLQSAKIDPSKLNMPDLAPGTELTNEQWKNDVAKAAEALVDLKVGALAETLNRRMTQKDGAGNALREIEAAKSKWKVLDHADDEHYNPDLDQAIGDSFYRIFKVDPSYSFSDHLRSFEPALKAAENASDGSTTDSRDSQGRFAHRPSSSSRRSAFDPRKSSMEELENYIHGQNGR